MKQKARFLGLAVGCVTLMGTSAYVFSQQRQPTPLKVLEVVSHTAKPQQRAFSRERLRQLKMPTGFRINVFATGLRNPRVMVVAPDGTVYVTRRDQNDVVMLRDRNGDGRADQMRVVASNLPFVHGIALRGNRLYFAATRRLWTARLRPDGTVSKPQLRLDDLPDMGQHPNPTLAFGPDRMLYMSVGSTCNACNEPNDESATILRIQPDTLRRTVYASGLRNTIGFDWNRTTHEMWGMDNGRDLLGDDLPPEELNRILPGRNYGWPFAFGNKKTDGVLFPNHPKGSITQREFVAKSQAPLLTYQAHSAPMTMAFYHGSQFPAEYRGDAFVAMRGSWNRNPPTGYKVVRIRFQDGKPKRIEDFLSGFLTEGGRAFFARPVGVAVARDGALLISDDTNGVIYRVLYQGAQSS